MKRILVIRNDKIGDFMLAWPSFAMLKTSMPDCSISAMVSGTNSELALLCPWIDEVIVDSRTGAGRFPGREAIDRIKSGNFDASICLFSTTYNALLVWCSGIPLRLAPATKVAQIFYNRRIVQRRSRSEKPEYEYNLDLIRAFLGDRKLRPVEPAPPYLVFSPAEIEAQRSRLEAQLNLRKGKPWIFVHAGSGGSANNLSLEQYADLVCGIEGDNEIVLTAGPGETTKAEALRQLIENRGGRAAVCTGNDGLADFARSIGCAAMFVAGSTGPLHIAAALDVPTVGFFPAGKSATPLRWQPLNSKGRHLAFCPPEAASEAARGDMGRIAIPEVLTQFNRWAKKFL